MSFEASLTRVKFFYGWYVVLAAAVGLFMGYVPMMGFSFGVFFKPLSQDFHWTRSQLSLAFSLSLLVLSVTLPITGRLVDRLGARRIIIPAVTLFGLGMISFCLLSGSLLQLYALYMYLGLVGSGTAAMPYYQVISRWFDRKRGLAMGLAMAGTGISFFILPYLTYLLIAAVGWRESYVMIGLAIILVTLPVVGIFLKETPESMKLFVDGEQKAQEKAEKPAKDVPGMSVHEAWHSGTFWVMCSALFLVSLSLNGCLIHLVPLLTDRGISPGTAAMAASVLGGATLLGRVGTGYLLDRFFATYVAVWFFSAAALGVLLLWGGLAGELVFLASFLIGLGIGAEGDIMAYLVSRYFGLRAFGEIYGYVLAIYTLGAVSGPLLMGIGFDRTGSYTVVLGPFLLLTLAGAALMTRLGPYRMWGPPAELVAD